jgi:hypothetical protein
MGCLPHKPQNLVYDTPAAGSNLKLLAGGALSYSFCAIAHETSTSFANKTSGLCATDHVSLPRLVSSGTP